MRALVCVLLSSLGYAAWAEPRVKLRMAAIAPDGTAWARELKALSRDVEAATEGAVQMRWILGGIAGDELQAIERTRRGQVDGAAGALFCQYLGPSLQALRLAGPFRSESEERAILQRLRPRLEEEMRKDGFQLLAVARFGEEVIFSREPVRSMADLRRQRFWTWSLDKIWAPTLTMMGVRTLPLPIEEAAAAYDDGRIDGFVAIPTALLAYQWSARARYFVELRAGFLPGCIVMHQRAFDALRMPERQALQAAVAKFIVRFEDLNATQDRVLLNGLLQKQGMHRIAPSERLVADYMAAAEKALRQVGEKAVPAALLGEIRGWLDELRKR